MLAVQLASSSVICCVMEVRPIFWSAHSTPVAHETAQLTTLRMQESSAMVWREGGREGGEGGREGGRGGREGGRGGREGGRGGGREGGEGGRERGRDKICGEKIHLNRFRNT